MLLKRFTNLFLFGNEFEILVAVKYVIDLIGFNKKKYLFSTFICNIINSNSNSFLFIYHYYKLNILLIIPNLI